MKGTGEFVTLERFLKGKFVKYMNNDGNCSNDQTDITKQAECLAHFSFEQSEEALLLTDIQGCGHMLTDPEIASFELAKDSEVLFCIRNFCRKAIKNFGLNHNCSKYCQFAGLSKFDKEYDDTIEFPTFA